MGFGLQLIEWLSFEKAAHAGNTLALMFIAFFLSQHVGIEGHEGMVERNDVQERMLTDLVASVDSLSINAAAMRESTTRSISILTNQIQITNLLSERRDVQDTLLTAEMNERERARMNQVVSELDADIRRLREENGFRAGER